MPTRIVVPALFLLVNLVPGLAIGQSEEPRAEFAEEMEVTEVLLDVLVTDSDGQIIVGLGKDDFEVEEAEKEGIDFEKRILKPSHPRDAYSNPYHGFTPFDMASRALGMRRRAFDLMVAKNCEIFRSVGRFSQRWYLPDLYLKELSGKKDFTLISAKYERMAATLGNTRLTDSCLE